MRESLNEAFDKLPVYWRLSTIRCLCYCIVVGFNGITNGLDGYTGFAEITWFTWFKLSIAVAVDMLMVWIAFLDSSIKTIAPNTESTTTTTAVNETKALPTVKESLTVAATPATFESKSPVIGATESPKP